MPTMRMPSTRASFSTLSARPVPLQQDVGPLDDLVGQAVVEIVVHLRDELGVGQDLEVEVVVRHGQCSFHIAEQCCIVEF